MQSIFGVIDFNSDNFSITKSRDSIEVISYGTIYNLEQLKKELKIQNDLTKNDLIKKIYEKFGVGSFKMLDGIFSIVILDKSSDMLYIVRDRSGIKPLYFYDFNDTLIFGSTLKDFYSVGAFTKKIDKRALAVYLSYGYILQPYSIFEHTQKIKAGHYLAYDLRNRDSLQYAYWSLESCYDEKKIDLKESEIITSIEEILYRSVQKRVDDSDGEIATTLSGGYDSSIVSALLSKIYSKKINTFTIGFEQQEINEAPFAKEVAKYLGTDHHEHYFTIKDAVEIVPKLFEVYDEPFADYGATPTVLVNQLVKNSGFDKLFIGDGGDEVFATADDVVEFENILKTPYPLRKSIYNILNILKLSKFPIINSYRNLPTKYYKFLEILKADNIPQMVKVKPILFFDEEIKELLRSDDVKFKTIFDEIDFPKNAQSVDQVIGTYFKTTMVDAELVKSFQAARAEGIRLKEPLLDSELIGFMAKIPQDIKIKDGEKKYLLKKIAHKYIPKELLDRPKSGFDIPFSIWLNGPLKELVFEQINEKRLKDDGLFDVNMVIMIRDLFYKGNLAYKYKLWTLFLFQLWYERVKD